MKYFLGIDQGGTKTQVAVCAGDGTVIGAVTGEPSIFYPDDPENRSTSTVRRLAEKILADAGLTWDSLCAACGGLSGVDWPHEVPLHEARLRDKLNLTDVIAVNDCVIALRAGSSAPDRCIVCAGTGLNIAAHPSDGTEYVYGYFIPDHLQGGSALGQAVIDTATEAEAGVRPPTMLTDVLLSCSGCASVERFLTDKTTRKISFEPQSLVPGLLDAFLAGDDAAGQILGAFINGVAGYIENALTRFFPPGRDTELVYSGGVFKGSGRVITDTFTRTLSQKFPRLRFTNARLEPVCGALLMLLDRMYNGNIPGGVTANFEKGCTLHGLIR